MALLITPSHDLVEDGLHDGQRVELLLLLQLGLVAAVLVRAILVAATRVAAAAVCVVTAAASSGGDRVASPTAPCRGAASARIAGLAVARGPVSSAAAAAAGVIAALLSTAGAVSSAISRPPGAAFAAAAASAAWQRRVGRLLLGILSPTAASCISGGDPCG